MRSVLQNKFFVNQHVKWGDIKDCISIEPGDGHINSIHETCGGNIGYHITRTIPSKRGNPSELMGESWIEAYQSV